MAKKNKPQEVEKIKPECCLTCKYLLTCAEVAGAKCRNYERKEIDKEAISTRYLEILKQLTDLTNELVIIETEMKIVEEVGILPEQPEEKPALSARNKKIIALMEQGLSVEEIAKQLKAQIDADATTYGVNVRAVRITDIDTPPELVQELAVIARARRAAQAKQIQAEAEVAVANKMAEASKILGQQKGGFHLREIQNLSAMSKEESSMIIVYPYESSAGKDIAHAAVASAVREISPKAG